MYDYFQFKKKDHDFLKKNGIIREVLSLKSNVYTIYTAISSQEAGESITPLI